MFGFGSDMENIRFWAAMFMSSFHRFLAPHMVQQLQSVDDADVLVWVHIWFCLGFGSQWHPQTEFLAPNAIPRPSFIAFWHPMAPQMHKNCILKPGDTSLESQIQPMIANFARSNPTINQGRPEPARYNENKPKMRTYNPYPSQDA